MGEPGTDDAALDVTFDPAQLRSFLAVAQALSFTQAAQRLGLRQSTVSQHVRKLEVQVDRVLLARDTHAVTLTSDGEAMVGFASSILDAQRRAADFFADQPVRGRLRFGVSDDLVLTRLPRLLRQFRRDHPLVDLELTVGLSGVLHRELADRRLDLVFAKRRPGETHGRLVWRDKLVWVAGGEPAFGSDEPVPLMCYPPPSITREVAINALTHEGRAWRMTFTCENLSGLRAAALAGLGVFVCPRDLVPAELRVVPARYRLPDLGGTEFVLIGEPAAAHGAARQPATALADAILSSGDRLRSPE